jgi:pimeloyl-ACP methyl ester carboxylesterase
MFFDIPIYGDGSSISDRILNSGFDILYVEPVGYGRGAGMVTPWYTREHLAEQLNLVVKDYVGVYDKIITSGFCSTTHAPLIAAMTVPVDGIFILSPIFGEANIEFSKKYSLLKEKPWPAHEYVFYNSIDNFIKNRLEDRSDSLIGGDHRVANWKTKFVDKLSSILPNNTPGEWTAVKDMLYDLWLYPAYNNSQGWQVENLSCKVFCLRGQFDYESNDTRFDHVCKELGDKVIAITVPGSSHFGMWENNFELWANEVIRGLNLLLTD